MSTWAGILQTAAEITENEPDDPQQGFMQLILSNGRFVRGRIEKVDAHTRTVFVIDRPERTDYRLTVSLDYLVTFEYVDMTENEKHRVVNRRRRMEAGS